MPTSTTITYGGQEYQISDFNIDWALSDEILFAKKPSEPDTEYKLTTGFTRNPQNASLPYSASVEGKYCTFDLGGVSPTGYVLVCGSAVIDSAGGTPGVVIPDSSTPTDGYYIPNLNFRESVAVEAMNAMITATNDPSMFSSAKIKLIVSKAFDFAKEFANQARTFRDPDAERSAGTSTDWQVTEESLGSIESILKRLADIQQGAFYKTVQDNNNNDVVMSITDYAKLGTDNSSGIKSALDGSSAGVSVDLQEIKTAITQIPCDPSGVSTAIGNAATTIADAIDHNESA